MTMDGAKRVHLTRLCPRPWRLRGCSGNCALDRSPWSCGGHKASLSSSQACPALSHTKGQLLSCGSWVLQTSILSEKQKRWNKENKTLALSWVPYFRGGVPRSFFFQIFLPPSPAITQTLRERLLSPLYKTVHLYFSLSPRKNCPSRISVLLYCNC